MGTPSVRNVTTRAARYERNSSSPFTAQSGATSGNNRPITGCLNCEIQNIALVIMSTSCERCDNKSVDYNQSTNHRLLELQNSNVGICDREHVYLLRKVCQQVGGLSFIGK